MTNNINGIDVSECRFYEPKAQKMTCHEEAITKSCESTPICYYKLLQKSYIELKRLQKENDELKKRQITKNGFICDCEQNAKFKQALEEIREITKNACDSSVCHYNCKQCSDGKIIEKINEVLNDRD